MGACDVGLAFCVVEWGGFLLSIAAGIFGAYLLWGCVKE